MNKLIDKIIRNKYLLLILIFHSIDVLIQSFFIDTLMIGYDSSSFINTARYILEGKGYVGQGVYFWGPLFALTIIGAHFLIGNWFLAGKLLTFFCSLIYLIFAYYDIKILWNEKISLITVFILSLTSTITLYSTIIANQMIYSALSAIAFYFFLKFIINRNNDQSNKLNVVNLILSGIFFGFSTLVRYDGYVIVLSVLIFLFYKIFKELNLKMAIKNSIIFSFAFTIINLPWYIINWLEYGTILYEKNYLNFALYYYFNDQDVFWTIYSHEFTSYFDVLFKFSLQDHIDHIIYNLIFFFQGIEFFIPFILIGIFYLPKLYKERKDGTIFSIIIIIPFFIAHILSLTKFRFYIVILPLAFGMFIYLLSYFLNDLGKLHYSKNIRNCFSKHQKAFYFSLVIVIFFLFSIQSLNYYNIVVYYQTNSNLYNEIDPHYVASVLKNISSPNQSIMTIHPTYGYYTGLNFVLLQSIPHLTLKERLESKTITSAYYSSLNLPLKDHTELVEPIPNYLVIDILVVNRVPSLTYLFNTSSNIPPYLHLVGHNNIAFVYSVNATLLLNSQ